MTWQKNLNRIPQAILAKAASFSKDDCEVACVKRISASDLQSGVYAHLRMGLEDGKPTYEPEVLPPPTVGRYSSKNVHGYEKVYRDLPMVTKQWSIDTPNFGDWSKGSHPIDFEREVYQREEFGPLLLPIRVSLVGSDIQKGGFVFKFVVGRVLNRKSKSFERDLLFDLNIAQENVGNHGLYPSNSTSADFLKSLYVNWEILPPGERDDNIARIMTGIRSDDPQVRAQLIERYDFLVRLQPMDFVKGTSGFQRYFGARFAENLIVFENVEYGNAAYIMFEDWERLSRLSRTELLSSPDLDYVRVPHVKYWKARVRSKVQERLRKNG